jgi:hypothetical protein
MSEQNMDAPISLFRIGTTHARIGVPLQDTAGLFCMSTILSNRLYPLTGQL